MEEKKEKRVKRTDSDWKVKSTNKTQVTLHDVSRFQMARCRLVAWSASATIMATEHWGTPTGIGQGQRFVFQSTQEQQRPVKQQADARNTVQNGIEGDRARQQEKRNKSHSSQWASFACWRWQFRTRFGFSHVHGTSNGASLAPSTSQSSFGVRCSLGRSANWALLRLRMVRFRAIFEWDHTSHNCPVRARWRHGKVFPIMLLFRLYCVLVLCCCFSSYLSSYCYVFLLASFSLVCHYCTIHWLYICCRLWSFLNSSTS